jgi:diguanylate cyclase (GGDEF)-like protein
VRATPHHLVEAVSAICAAGALLIAGSALAGVDLPLRPAGSPQVTPLAAFGLASGALAVLLSGLSYRRRTFLMLWAGATALLVLSAVAGIATRVLAAEPGAPSPGAATALSLIAAGLLLQRATRRLEGVAGALFLITAAFASAAVNAYTLVDVSTIAQVGIYGSIALQTSIGVLLLSLAALTAGGQRGIAGLLARRSAGGQLARAVVPMLLLGPGVLGALVHLGATLGLYPVELERSFTVAIITVAITLAFWPAAARIDHVERHRAAAEQLSLVDPLTGLANRRRLEDRMALAGAVAARDGTPYAVMALDVDGLKRVNDTYGHAEGDRLIEATAAALHAAMRPLDTAARVGGDEFVVLLPGVGESEAARTTGRIAAEVMLRLRDPAFHGAGVSTGHAVWSPGLDPESVLAAADRELYEHKARRTVPAGPLRVGREGIEPPQSKDG